MSSHGQPARSEVEVSSSASTGWVVPELLQPSTLMRSNYLKPSAWAEHVPFAFWLVEALSPRVLVELGSHYGTSYFAFCQAIDRLGLASNCFAVDTWCGDEHAGFYGNEVYETVSKHNSSLYSRFSTLVRSTFEEALGHFEDGTVDLLHIDGLHTFEAVAHDFQSWLPKMSTRGVVVMHDTNVRERGFGVFKLFSELKQRYPHFEFVHGHGLGVLGVGHDVASALQRLFDLQQNEGARGQVQELFSRLGRGCDSELQLVHVQEALEQVKADQNLLSGELKHARETVGSLREEVKAQSSELAEVRHKYNDLYERNAVERGQYEERVRLLSELRDDLRAELAEHRKKVEVPQLHVSSLAKDNCVALPAQSEIQALQRQLDERFNEIAVLTKMLGEAEKRLATRDNEFSALKKEADSVRSRNSTLEAQLAASQAEVNALRSSTSWRLMAPARWLVVRLKGIF